MTDTLIANTSRHARTGLLISSFSADGSKRMTVLRGDKPVERVTLDAKAVVELTRALRGKVAR